MDLLFPPLYDGFFVQSRLKSDHGSRRALLERDPFLGHLESSGIVGARDSDIRYAVVLTGVRRALVYILCRLFERR